MSSNRKRPFRGKIEQRNCYMGPIWAFLGKLIWDRCRHTHVGLPRMVPDGSHITVLLEQIQIHVCLFVCLFVFNDASTLMGH